MKSRIIFFDTLANSKIGTLRTMVIYPIYIILSLIWIFSIRKSFYKKYVDTVSTSRIVVMVILSGVLIVSALGTHRPDTLKKAVVYAGLVGFVVYGISNCVLLSVSNKWDYLIASLDTLWGIVSTALLGLILYYAVISYPKIFNYS